MLYGTSFRIKRKSSSLFIYFVFEIFYRLAKFLIFHRFLVEKLDCSLLQKCGKNQITLNSLNITTVENIRGAVSTVIELTLPPSSNDIVPVRDQIVEIDVANSSVTVEPDTFVGGSADAGIGYSTATSY